MTEYKTFEGHPIEVGKWYAAEYGFKVYVIGFNPFNEVNPIVVAHENGLIEVSNAAFLLRPAPGPKPVVEGWLELYRSTAGMTGIVVRGEGDYYYKIPDMKLRYDPNKTGVDSITILEVKDD